MEVARWQLYTLSQELSILDFFFVQNILCITFDKLKIRHAACASIYLERRK
jgi:hypothetical protein